MIARKHEFFADDERMFGMGSHANWGRHQRPRRTRETLSLCRGIL